MRFANVNNLELKKPLDMNYYVEYVQFSAVVEISKPS